MRLPSKTTQYERSVIPYFSRIAGILENGDAAPQTVYEKLDMKDKNIGDYLDALDCMYALGRMELTEGGLLHYAG